MNFWLDLNPKLGTNGKNFVHFQGEVTDDTLLKDFRTEYAKSGAAKCRVCEEKIAKVLFLLPLLD